ncbi:MAG: O-antigen ligase family protein [Steroidobacteraceae bacterium]
MKYLIAILFVVVFFCDVYGVGLSFGPGLSVKNAMLYMAAMAFTLRMVVQGGFKFTLPRLHGAFALIIGYALLSVLYLVLIVKWEDYRVFPAVIALKSNLIDHFLFFAVCYYGAQTTADALHLLRILMYVVVASSVITVVNASGVFTIGVMEISESGRVQGALGEHNQYASFLATMIPPLVAAFAVSRKALAKLFWAGGILLSLISMIMTVSRGGMLALIVASLWGTFYFRRYLPVGRIVTAGALCLVAILIFAALSGTYGELLQERVIGQTFVSTGDASSGRSEIWETAINRMMESPWTLFTGFGWFAYESMGFRFITHNTYLLWWFNLGVMGATAFTFILAHVFRTASKATAVASPEVRPHLMGLAVGVFALSVAIFFVNLFGPWSYIWSLVGLCTRLAVNELSARNQIRAEKAIAVNEARGPRVRYGWRAAGTHQLGELRSP